MSDPKARDLAAKTQEQLRPTRRRQRPSRGQTFTAIDLDGRVLRVAQAVRRGSKVVVTRLASERLPVNGSLLRLDDAQGVGEWLGRALARLRIKPGLVVMGVPRGKVVLKALTLPLTDDPNELAAMIELQVAREIPIAPEEAVVDFSVQSHYGSRSTPASESATVAAAGRDGESTPGEKIAVLVAALRSEVVEHYRTMAKAAGLKLHALGLRSYANVCCVDLCVQRNREDSVALVYLRPDEVIVDVLIERSLAFSRATSVALPPDEENETDPRGSVVDESSELDASAIPTDAMASGTAEDREARLVAAIAGEVALSLRSYEGMLSEGGVRQVVIAGVAGIEGAVADALRERLSVPCELLDLGSRFGLAEGDQKEAPAAIAAIGLAISINERRGLPFDFLHPKRARVRRRPTWVRPALVTAAVIIAVVFGLWARGAALGRRTVAHEGLRSQISVLQLSERGAKMEIARAASVMGWSQGARSWLDHWAYLTAVLPDCKDVYLTRLTTSQRGTVQFSLRARNGAILSQLDEKLRAAGYQVRPVAVTPVEDKYGYNFSTAVEVTVPAGMAIPLDKVEPPPRPEDDGSLGVKIERPSGVEAAPERQPDRVADSASREFVPVRLSGSPAGPAFGPGAGPNRGAGQVPPGSLPVVGVPPSSGEGRP